MKTSELNFIQALTSDEVIRFKTLSHPLHVKAGYVIFEEAANADCIYWIESGHVKIYHNTILGKISMVSIRKSGDAFGIGAVLLGENRSAFAETVDESQLWCMESKLFREVLYEYPRLAVQVAIIQCKYLRESQRAIGNLMSLDVEHRMAWLLMKLAITVTTPRDKKLRITVQLTHQDMASMIGTCRQTVTTVLGRFKKAGLIYVSEEGIDIVDFNKLNQYIV